MDQLIKNNSLCKFQIKDQAAKQIIQKQTTRMHKVKEFLGSIKQLNFLNLLKGKENSVKDTAKEVMQAANGE